MTTSLTVDNAPRALSIFTQKEVFSHGNGKSEEVVEPCR